MNDISYSLNIDVTSQLLSYDVYVASKNDTNIRYLNIALFENGNAVPLSENASATASFVTNNVLIDEDIACTIDGNIITVPLTDLQQHGNLDIQVTVTDGNKTLATPYPIQVKVTPNIAETAQIDENSMGSYAEVVQEIATARDGYNNLDERLDSMTSESAATYERLANKSQTINPTQQSGDDDNVNYPSVNAARSYTNSKFSYLNNYVNAVVGQLDLGKADKTDVYTKAQVYTKAEANNRFADASTTYTKAQTDDLVTRAASVKESLSHKVQSINENTSADDEGNYPSVYAARSYTNSKFTNLKDYVDGEVGTLNSAKADKTDVYTKTQVYNKAEANNRFAEAETTYTKTETDLNISQAAARKESLSHKVQSISENTSADDDDNYPSVYAVRNYTEGKVNTLNSTKADKSEVYTKTAADDKFEVNTNKAGTIYPAAVEGENNLYPSVTAVRNYVGSRYSDMSDYVDEELDSLYDTIQGGLNGKEDKINKVTEITDGSTANQYPTVAAVKNYVDGEVTALDSAKADKSDVYTKAAANIKFEDKANKVTEITDGSTANQYPTAVAVKNYVDGEVTALDSAKADKSEVYTKAAANIKFEDKSNKVTEITDGSTANQYPTATAVKNYVDGEVAAIDEAKANKSDTYTKAAANIKFEGKANKVQSISDDEVAGGDINYPSVAAVKNYRNALLEKSRKNLIAFPNVTIDNNGVHYSINNNWITVSGTADTASNAYGIIDFETPIELEAGTYMASIRDEENPPSNVMIYFYIQGRGDDDPAFQINGGGAKKRKYEPTETVFIRRVIIGVGAGEDASTATTKTTAFYLQLEKGDEASDYEPPVDTYKIKHSLIPDNIPDKAYVKKAVNNMNYIYVSKDYDESTEGFGKIYFNSIIAANDSITDNSKETPYTIIVKSGTTAEPCVYDEFEDLYGEEFDEQYGGNTDEIPLQGVRTKNYVYYESETPDNPAACVLKWDGAEGYLKWDGEEDYREGELTNELAAKKCIFHLTNGLKGMHTHIKGFTIESKNTRYGIHMESGGYGRNEEWVVENCIIEYGGRPDVYKGSVTPIIGMGMSPHEKGTIRNVKAFYSDGFTDGTRALNCHDNYETAVYTNVPSVIAGAKLTIDNCDFCGYAIGLSRNNTERTDPVSDTPHNLYLINNVNISETVVASGNWIVVDLTTAEGRTSIAGANIQLSSTNFVYDGSSHVPNVSAVTLNGQTLTPNVDYVVVSVPATNAGTYIITINGIGNYSGTATANWTISKAQSTISGDASILISGAGNSITKTYTTDGDGTFSFSLSNNIATLSNTGGAVTVTAVSVGAGNILVSVSEGENYLGATKTVSLTIDDYSSANVFGVVWDYSLSSPELTRLTPQTDPLNVVTTGPEQEPTACIGTEGGQSDFDNYMPWAGMQRFNYANGQIVDFVDYTNGETYVYIPEFWSKIVDDSANQKMYFYISDSELNGFTLHPGSGRYVGRYECNSNFLSAPGTTPKVNTNLGGFRTGITAIDNKHYQYDIHTYNALELLYIVEFANLNTQATIGAGIISGVGALTIGETDILTYHTGRVNGAADNVSAVQYRWIENLWGNVWNWVDGILIQDGLVYICNDRANYASSITNDYESTGLYTPTDDGWYKTSQDYNNCYLIPLTTGSSDSTYTCDYYNYDSGVRGLRVGSAYGSSSYAGLFYWYGGNAPGATHGSIGGRAVLILNNGGNG